MATAAGLPKSENDQGEKGAPRIAFTSVCQEEINTNARCASRPNEQQACYFCDGSELRPRLLLVFCNRRRQARDNEASQEESERGRKETVTAKGVQHEGLHVKQPQGHREHGTHGPGEQSLRALGAEPREGRETEGCEKPQNPQKRHGQSGYFRVGTAKHLDAAYRSAASRGFTGHGYDREVNRIGESRQ